MADIIKIQSMADALRNTGYKNIESAMSEIIDNSIQWCSKNVFVIVSEKLNSKTGKKNINEIAFLDNGYGMDTETLAGCLELGFSTNKERKGMGRFGVGLPQSSMYACPRVEVYSWSAETSGYSECQKVYLDMRKVQSGEQTQIDDPVKCEIPEKYRKYLEYKIGKNDEIEKIDFKKHGTLVIWKDCDRVNPKTVYYLFDRLDYELGRRFRYFIDKGESQIRLILNGNEEFSRNVMPNDPLLLMKSNIVLGNPNKPGDICPRSNEGCTESLFEIYTDEKHPDGIIHFPVKYIKPYTDEIAEEEVQIRFSKVKNIFYDQTAIPGDPGRTDMGGYVKKLEGISIVRAGREIDFGQFDFYDKTNEPQHRWWGCEISFNPVLDEAFGVANNKQHVELKELDENDYIDDEVKPMWIQLHSIISDTISSIYKKNKEIRAKSRTTDDMILPSTKIINNAESKRDDKNIGTSVDIKNNTDIKELNKKSEEELKKEGIENPTEEDIRKYMNNSVNITYRNNGKFGGLFDYSFEFGNALLTINIDHIFYKTSLEKAFLDPEVKTAFEFLLAAFVKSVDVTKASQNEQNDRLIAKWNERLRDYVEEQQNNN